MSQTSETVHEKFIQHGQAFELLLANPEVMFWFGTTLEPGRERNNLIWDYRRLDEETMGFVTQIMFGELLVHEPANGSLIIEVRSEDIGRPTYNSRYTVPLERDNQSKIESKVENPEHDSLVPIAQLNYWLTQLIGLLTERKTPEVVKL